MNAGPSAMRQALNRLGRSLAFRLFLALVTLYTLYHCVAAFSDRLVTDTVIEGEERITVGGEAVIFRDETVLTVTGKNYLCSYPLANGAKVNAATVLAELFSTSGDAETIARNQSTLNALDRQIALIEATPSADSLSALTSLRAQARNTLLDTVCDITNGAPMSKISDGAFSLLLSLNRIGALTGEGGSTATLADTLRADRRALLMSAGYTSRTMTAADVGTNSTGGYFYYSSNVDGYEEIFQHSLLSTMELSDFDALLVSPRRDYGTGVTVVGKLANSYHWSIALPLEPDAAASLEVGKSYAVTFTDEYDLTLTMTLDRLIGSRAEGRIIAVLGSDTTPSNFTYTRFSNVELTVKRTQGYRVPETALVESDGRDGVYILDGGRVCFRTVEILMRGDGYVLVYAPTKAQREDKNDETYHADHYIALRDTIITEGNRLYDGKYID